MHQSHNAIVASTIRHELDQALAGHTPAPAVHLEIVELTYRSPQSVRLEPGTAISRYRD